MRGGHARVGRSGVGNLDLRQRQRLDATTRIELPLVERGPNIDVDDEQVLDELLGPRDEESLLVEHERRAVEDELVLPTDEVRVDDRHRRVGGARREHRLAFGESLRVIRRRVEVDDELRAARGLGEDRAGRAPRVLTDRDPDLHARDVEERQRFAGRDEIALLVEDAVIREQLLAVHAVHTAVRAHGRRVVQVAARFGKPDDRGRPRGTRRDLVEHLDAPARRTPDAAAGPRAGYPVTVSSGNTTRSQPAASAASYASRMRAALPSRSPTTTFNWAAATRKRGIVPGYEGVARDVRDTHDHGPLAG